MIDDQMPNSMQRRARLETFNWLSSLSLSPSTKETLIRATDHRPSLKHNGDVIIATDRRM